MSIRLTRPMETDRPALSGRDPSPFEPVTERETAGYEARCGCFMQTGRAEFSNYIAAILNKRLLALVEGLSP